MHLIFIFVVFLVLRAVLSFDFDGSGDETSFNLENEELIPYTKTKFINSVLQKKTRKLKNKQPTHSTIEVRKGGFQQSNARYYDLCRHFRCSHTCQLSNNNNAFCLCHEGFELHIDGKSCKDIDECHNFNGGCEQVCINTIGSYRCKCQEHFRLRNDSKVSCEAFCEPPCLNNGECIGPNICSCPPGYLQPKCSPICNPPCANGGVCKRHNTCKCSENYSGPTCLIALCKPRCLNRGRCIAPNVCQCPSNYFGEICQKALCVPPCEHSGTCIEANQCICRSGFKGPRCQTESIIAEHAACNPHCTSTSLAESTHAKLKHCSPPCQNGGRCTVANKCICMSGTYGNKCQYRRCPVITFTSKITRMVRIHVTETFLSDCHTGAKQKCVSYRLIEKMIPKTFHKLHCS